MAFERRILHYSPGPTDLIGQLDGSTVVSAWFELSRRGGCTRGEVVLNDEFADRDSIDVGDWLAFDYETGDRWYLGRVEKRTARHPAGVTLHLYGPAGEMDEVFPGGYGTGVADGSPPHHFGQPGHFADDPDTGEEDFDSISKPHELVDELIQQYVEPNTHIVHDAGEIEEPTAPTALTSMKFRGDESVFSILQQLSIQARDASWGVDADRTFFFLEPRTDLLQTFIEKTDLVSLNESRDRESLYNRISLVGGFVYGPEVSSSQHAKNVYRWTGNFIENDSRTLYGERRIRLHLPWMRTLGDSQEFVREFFRLYAAPQSRFQIEVANQSSLIKPWEGVIRVEDQFGTELVEAQPDVIRVQFDHQPRLTISIGAVDPTIIWPDSGIDDRWPVPGDEDPEHGGAVVNLASADETDDTPWMGSTDDKFYLTSGAFSSTLKTSQACSWHSTPYGICWDGENCLSGSSGSGFKLFLTSGQFSSTIKDSQSVTRKKLNTSDDGTNTFASKSSDDINGQLYKFSGKITSTIKDSQDTSAWHNSAFALTFDGTNTPWISSNGVLRLVSGAFTSTIKTSQSTSTNSGGISWNGTDTFVATRHAGVSEKLVQYSGQFTSTIKTSQSVGTIDSVPFGIDTNSVSSRLGI